MSECSKAAVVFCEIQTSDAGAPTPLDKHRITPSSVVFIKICLGELAINVSSLNPRRGKRNLYISVLHFHTTNRSDFIQCIVLLHCSNCKSVLYLLLVYQSLYMSEMLTLECHLSLKLMSQS